MNFINLQSFLDELSRRGDLAVIETPVSPHLEVAEIHRRAIAGGGPALLFTRVEGSDFPLVTNLFGTADRAAMAFGSRPGQLVRKLVELVQTAMPPDVGDLWRARDLVAAAFRIGTRKVRTGPVAEVLQEPPNLDRLPVLTSWAEDGGPFVTLPLVYTEHPENGGSNLGMYRLQIHDRTTTGMHWQIGKGGGFHYRIAEAAGRSLPVTVFLGGPPALILAAVAPLPENVPELVLASLISGARLRRCAGPGVHALVAEAEFALVGHVAARERLPEGPFGDHYGYYSLRHDYPVFRVDCIAHRRQAVFPATVVGKPRQEDFYIGDQLQELLSPLFPVVMPAVKDLWSYGETGYHALAAAIVRERYGREAMASAFRILGEGQLSLTKFLLVTDRGVDLRDFRATLECVLERTRPETDLFVFSNLSMDTLDYTGPEVNRGSKGVWLGVGEKVRDLPREFSSPDVPPGLNGAEVFCGGCLVIGGPTWTKDVDFPKRVADHTAFREWPLIVVVDDVSKTTVNAASFLWTTFTRFEPAADLHARFRVYRHHLCYEAPVVLDARMKSSYPDELFCDPETSRKVDRRWKEYFPYGGVEMGDSDRANLDRW
ncbi:MAG: UbiD family decarboxylase [Thermoanaerobaculales bacterium]|nr:UbiD family decarboxylase [Thermoanaerobaculales bacterium]